MTTTRRRNEPVHSVTNVRVSPAEDRRRREKQYLFTMGLRLLCFGLAMVITGPLRWVVLAGAVFLPWIAVLLANNRGTPPVTAVLDPGTRSLAAASRDDDAAAQRHNDASRTDGSRGADEVSGAGHEAPGSPRPVIPGS